MSTEIVPELVSNLPAVRERSSVLLMPVMDVNTAMARLVEFQTFCSHYLQESKDGGLDGGDYGTIPNAGQKKVLLKSGADKLCEIYGLYDEYVMLSTVEDWDKGLFDYTLKCVLKSRRDDSTVGAGVGSCSSFESKYRWREAKRVCPQCGKENIRKSKPNRDGSTGGWYCWLKTDGCGATFKDGDPAIDKQVTGRVENPDIIDTKNTVLKMAKKRAKIDATIGVTRSSGIFTQDLDDLPIPPPDKPKVEVTKEPIELGVRPGKGLEPNANADARSVCIVPATATGYDGIPYSVDNAKPDITDGRAATPAVEEEAVRPEPSPAPNDGPYCTKAENTSFFAEVYKALPEGLREMHEDWGRAWLKDNGHVAPDAKKGGLKGSLKKTPKALFPVIMREVMATIDKLKANMKFGDSPLPWTVETPLVITDDDVPF